MRQHTDQGGGLARPRGAQHQHVRIFLAVGTVEWIKIQGLTTAVEHRHAGVAGAAAATKQARQIGDVLYQGNLRPAPPFPGVPVRVIDHGQVADHRIQGGKVIARRNRPKAIVKQP